MNKFMAGLKNTDNFTYTENGALTHKSTMSDLYDLFAMGGAYRSRSNEDVIVLFNNALKENEVYALKCLFYLRDARGGQGERRFFRVAMKWLASTYPEIARRNLRHIPEFGRSDDLYLFVDTPLEAEAFAFMRQQLSLDVQCKTPSLLAKWLKSENASSNETRRLAIKTRKHFGITAKQYRKTLSVLRARINVLECPKVVGMKSSLIRFPPRLALSIEMLLLATISNACAKIRQFSLMLILLRILLPR